MIVPGCRALDHPSQGVMVMESTKRLEIRTEDLIIVGAFIAIGLIGSLVFLEP